MRISDWSSDVCSSDLRVGPHLMGPNVYLAGAGNSAEDGNNVYELDAATADRFLQIKIIPTIDGFVEHGIENKFHPLILAFIRNHQIGRAPCRERVCQYV